MSYRSRGEVQDVWQGPGSQGQMTPADGEGEDSDCEGGKGGIEKLGADSGSPEEIHQRLLDKGE